MPQNLTITHSLVSMWFNVCAVSRALHHYRYNELTIHGLGAAINRAINLALKLQESSPYELKVRILIDAHCLSGMLTTE